MRKITASERDSIDRSLIKSIDALWVLSVKFGMSGNDLEDIFVGIEEARQKIEELHKDI